MDPMNQSGLDDITPMQQKKVWIVLDEFRGEVKFTCEIEATALRHARTLKAGEKGPRVVQEDAYLVACPYTRNKVVWLIPATPLPPSIVDVEEQEALDRKGELRRWAVQRALALGLSEEEIQALSLQVGESL